MVEEPVYTNLYVGSCKQNLFIKIEYAYYHSGWAEIEFVFSYITLV